MRPRNAVYIFALLKYAMKTSKHIKFKAKKLSKDIKSICCFFVSSVLLCICVFFWDMLFFKGFFMFFFKCFFICCFSWVLQMFRFRMLFLFSKLFFQMCFCFKSCFLFKCCFPLFVLHMCFSHIFLAHVFHMVCSCVFFMIFTAFSQRLFHMFFSFCVCHLFCFLCVVSIGVWLFHQPWANIYSGKCFVQVALWLGPWWSSKKPRWHRRSFHCLQSHRGLHFFPYVCFICFFPYWFALVFHMFFPHVVVIRVSLCFCMFFTIFKGCSCVFSICFPIFCFIYFCLVSHVFSYVDFFHEIQHFTDRLPWVSVSNLTISVQELKPKVEERTVAHSVFRDPSQHRYRQTSFNCFSHMFLAAGPYHAGRSFDPLFAYTVTWKVNLLITEFGRSGHDLHHGMLPCLRLFLNLSCCCVAFSVGLWQGAQEESSGSTFIIIVRLGLERRGIDTGLAFPSSRGV